MRATNSTFCVAPVRSIIYLRAAWLTDLTFPCQPAGCQPPKRAECIRRPLYLPI